MDVSTSEIKQSGDKIDHALMELMDQFFGADADTDSTLDGLFELITVLSDQGVIEDIPADDEPETAKEKWLAVDLPKIAQTLTTLHQQSSEE